MSISHSDARNISAAAARTGALVLGGQLTQQGDHFFVNQTDVTQLLAELTRQNVVIIVSAIDDAQEETARVCLTCGRDYTGPECPHCAHIRSRLRR